MKALLAALFRLLMILPASAATLEAQRSPVSSHPLEYLDTSFENASPLWYEVQPDGSVLVHLIYDHERSSPNRAAGHIYFQIHAQPGARLALEFTNLNNVWNGRPGSVARELKAVVVSQNGRDWVPTPLESLPENRVRLHVEMPGPLLYVARVEPYRLSDHDRLLQKIRSHPRVQVSVIGNTVQGRQLEIVRIGAPRAPYRAFVRARAHPWESGGNWIVEGLVDRLLREDDDARRYLERYCVYIQPLANKDGVALGRTRFNLKGKDLNRNWDQPADEQLAPENAALERWLEERIAAGQGPHLALELHNDGGGRLHISRPPVPELQRYLERMTFLEKLLRRHTWFTEGSTTSAYRNTGTLGEGWLQRYHIDALVHEFNCNWIAGLNAHPTARHWKEYGEKLATVFYEYFEEIKP
jgi:hypothetical protein